MATATTDPVRLPPALPLPKLVQSVLFLTSLQYSVVPRLSRHYGGPFTINLPIFGKTVVLHDREIVKDVYSTSFDLIERPTKVLGQAFGPGSTFSLLGKEHSERRKLVLPNFSGKRVKNYESIVEDEVLRETANWPEGQEFETLETMTRLTLNAIMRATFGERADALDELRIVIPPLITLGSLLQRMPPVVRREYGRWSPGSKLAGYRRRFDAVIDELIAEARAESSLDGRTDMLALLLQARYEDGQPISDRHIADELLTLVAAGHETTASQLAWAVERLRRHPEVMTRLAEEVDAGGSDLRQATIYEVQRVRPTIAASLRTTKTRGPVGRVGSSRRHRRDDRFSTRARVGRQLHRPGSVQPGPLRRKPAAVVPLGAVWRRHKPLRRSIVRPYGDGYHAADAVARIPLRADRCARRKP